ncbi:MAG: hypothetical protein WCJ61_13850, partial [Paludibacter sp.]
DFNFYEKIKVPPPTWCSECRMIRRLTFRNERDLHKSKCSLCGKMVISIYSEKNPMNIFCQDCWWGDAWDSFSFGVEYDFSNNTGMQLMDVDNNNAKFTNENERMKTNLNNVQTIKIGGEYKLTNNFALRAGFANTSNANNPDAYKQMYENTVRMDPQFFIHNSTNYLTAGFGYREASWFVDFAYVNKILDETFYPYDSSALTGASVITKTNNIVVTLGLKF